MGCAPSSAARQDVSVAVAERAGLRPETRLSDDRPAPQDCSAAHLVATDDAVALNTLGERHSRRTGRYLDRAFSDHGVARNEGEGCDDAADLMMIGVNLNDGAFLAPGMGTRLLFLSSTDALPGAGEAPRARLGASCGHPALVCTASETAIL